MDDKNKDIDDFEIELDEMDDSSELDDHLEDDLEDTFEEDDYENFESSDDWEDDISATDDNSEKKKGGKGIFIVLLLLIIGGGGFYFWTTKEGTNYLNQFNKITEVTDTLKEQIDVAEDIVALELSNDSLIIDDLPPVPDSFDPENQESNTELNIVDIPDVEVIEDDMVFEEISIDNIDSFEVTIDDNETSELVVEDIIIDEEVEIIDNTIEEVDYLTNMNTDVDLPKAEDIIIEAPVNNVSIELENKIVSLLNTIENLEDQLSKKEDNQQIIYKMESNISILEGKISILEKEVVISKDLLSESEKLQAELLGKLEKKNAKPKPRKIIKKKPTAKKPILTRAAKINWILKSAKPGKAWISKSGSNDMIVIEKGMQVPGLGVISSIGIVSGKWVVQGSNSSLSQ